MENKGVARIGNGGKLHPAVKHPTYGIMFRCSCPGTKSGHATWSAQFFPNREANCKN
jgi:hypothetical protein